METQKRIAQDLKLMSIPAKAATEMETETEAESGSDSDSQLLSGLPR